MTTIRLKNQLSEIDHLYRILVQFGNTHHIPSNILDALNLALEEIITNIISYAFPNDGEHSILLRLTVVAHELIAEVEDDGRPFNPLETPDPDIDLPLEDRPIGGLGILLTKKMVDHIEYALQNGKNLVRIKKNLTP